MQTKGRFSDFLLVKYRQEIFKKYSFVVCEQKEDFLKIDLSVLESTFPDNSMSFQFCYNFASVKWLYP